MKRVTSILLCVMLVAALLPLGVSAAVKYNAGDVAVINNIITKNGLKGFQKNKPATWKFAKWNNGRVISLDLAKKALKGDLNLFGLAALQSLNCTDNKLTSLNLEGLKKLKTLNYSRNPLNKLVFPDRRTLHILTPAGGTVTIENDPKVAVSKKQVKLTYRANKGRSFESWSLIGNAKIIGGSVEETQITLTLPSTKYAPFNTIVRPVDDTGKYSYKVGTFTLPIEKDDELGRNTNSLLCVYKKSGLTLIEGIADESTVLTSQIFFGDDGVVDVPKQRKEVEALLKQSISSKLVNTIMTYCAKKKNDLQDLKYKSWDEGRYHILVGGGDGPINIRLPRELGLE